MSSKSRIIRVNALLTTNGVLLEKKFDELYDAGLRRVALGIYGNEESYPFYVQRSDPYSQIVRGIARARERWQGGYHRAGLAVDAPYMQSHLITRHMKVGKGV